MQDKTLKWAAILGIATISISVAYYFLWFMPQKESLEQAVSRQERIDKCIEKVDAQWKPQMQMMINGAGAVSEQDFKTTVESITASWNRGKADCAKVI